jgi:hypothetical protein
MNIDELLDILETNSPIMYYHIVELFMIEDKEFYINKILECDPKIKGEKIYHLYYKYYSIVYI